MHKYNVFEISAVLIIVALTVFTGFSCANGPSTAPLEGVTWTLQSYGDPGNLKAALPGYDVTLIFDKDKKQVSGNGGVNGYGGDYSITGSQLIISGIIHTEMASTNDALNIQESAFFQILGSSQSFKISGNELSIAGAEGTLVFSSK